MSPLDEQFLKKYLSKADEHLPLRERRIKAARRLIDDSAFVYVDGEYWIRAYLEEVLSHDITEHKRSERITRLEETVEELEGQIDDLENEIREIG